MNKTIDALKLAEEALESCNSGKWGMSFDEIDVERALASIREALAEQEKQEPVAFVSDVHLSRYTLEWNGQPLPEGTKLYAAPVSVEAIRAEALEEAAKVCRTAQAKGLQSIREAIEAAIRGLK